MRVGTAEQGIHWGPMQDPGAVPSGRTAGGRFRSLRAAESECWRRPGYGPRHEPSWRGPGPAGREGARQARSRSGAWISKGWWRDREAGRRGSSRRATWDERVSQDDFGAKSGPGRADREDGAAASRSCCSDGIGHAFGGDPERQRAALPAPRRAVGLKPGLLGVVGCGPRGSSAGRRPTGRCPPQGQRGATERMHLDVGRELQAGPDWGQRGDSCGRTTQSVLLKRWG